MAWFCLSCVLLPLLLSVKDKQPPSSNVGKMEQIAAIIVSELLPCLFTQFCPLKFVAPVFCHQHRSTNTLMGKYCRFFILCLPVVVLPDWFWVFIFCMQSQQTDVLRMVRLFMRSLGSRIVLSVQGSYMRENGPFVLLVFLLCFIVFFGQVWPM